MKSFIKLLLESNDIDIVKEFMSFANTDMMSDEKVFAVFNVWKTERTFNEDVPLYKALSCSMYNEKDVNVVHKILSENNWKLYNPLVEKMDDAVYVLSKMCNAASHNSYYDDLTIDGIVDGFRYKDDTAGIILELCYKMDTIKQLYKKSEHNMLLDVYSMIRKNCPVDKVKFYIDNAIEADDFESEYI